MKKRLIPAQFSRTSGEIVFKHEGRAFAFPAGMRLPLVDSLEGPCIRYDDLEKLEKTARIEITTRAIKQ